MHNRLLLPLLALALPFSLAAQIPIDAAFVLESTTALPDASVGAIGLAGTAGVAFVVQ